MLRSVFASFMILLSAPACAGSPLVSGFHTGGFHRGGFPPSIAEGAPIIS
jgi:hypothetical protein